MEQKEILFYAQLGVEAECKKIQERVKESHNNKELEEMLEAEEKKFKEITRLYVEVITKK